MSELACEVVRDLMPTYADGIADEKTEKLVREHIASCESCRKALEAMCEDEKKPSEKEKTEIDFLKKSRRKAVTLAVIAGAVFALAALLVVILILTKGRKNGGAPVVENVNFSDEMREAVLESWASYNSKTRMEQMLMSTSPGYLFRNFGTWDDAMAFLGFRLPNPFEENEDYEAIEYVDHPSRDERKIRAYMTWIGDENGEIRFVSVSADYSFDGMRVIYTALPQVFVAKDGDSYYFVSPAQMDPEAEGIEAEDGISFELNGNGKFDAGDLKFTLDGVDYCFRVIDENKKGGEAFTAAVEKIREVIKGMMR